MDGACAVEELQRAVARAGEGIAGDEGEEGDGLAGAGGHLEEAMTTGVQSALQLHHVLILLRVDVLVGEVHRHILDLEFHGCC